MERKTVKRLIHGFGANAYGQLVTVVIQLVGVPILLHAWGPQLYGEWLILFAIPAYLLMTDLGFSQSASNDMTARVARGDRAGALSVFQSVSLLVYGAAALVLILSSLLICSLPLHDWLNFGAMSASELRWTLILLVLQVVVVLPNGVNHAGFRAGGDYALHTFINATTRLLQFVSIWITALGGGGPVSAAAVSAGIGGLATLGAAILLARRHPWLRFGFARARCAELRGLARPALANVAIPTAQALNIQGMVLVVGAVMGPLAVVVFSTLRTLTRLAFQLSAAVCHAAEPELAAAFGAGRRDLMRSLFTQALRASLWLALTAAAGLALFGSVILETWTHGRVLMVPALFSWLLGSAVASVLWYGALIVLRAANRHLRAANVYLVVAATALGMAAVLVGSTDNLASVGLALLFLDAAMALCTMNAAARVLNARPLKSLWLAVNPYPLVTTLLRQVSQEGRRVPKSSLLRD